MEKQLFTWKDWERIDTAAFNFYKVKLVQELPGLAIGTKFYAACVNYELGTLTLYVNAKLEIAAKFSLGLVVN